MTKISLICCSILFVIIGIHFFNTPSGLLSKKIEPTVSSKDTQNKPSLPNFQVTNSLVETETIINQPKPTTQKVEQPKVTLLKKSLMDQYIDEELWLAIIPEDDELHEYLMTLWDGQSATIPDAIYDIEIEKFGNSLPNILVAHKDRITSNSSADFAVKAQEKSIEEINRNEELGEYSVQKERYILNLANPEDVEFQSLMCRESKCSMHIQATNNTDLLKFTDELSNIPNANIQIFKSDDSRAEAQVFVYYSK